MGNDNEAANDSCSAHDELAADPPSVIRPTSPQTVQVPVGPAAGSAGNPVLAPLPATAEAPPPVPQLQLRSDAIIGQDHAVDPNDKGFGVSGTWDSAGAGSGPRVTGAYADVPNNSPRIHGDPAQLDVGGGAGGGNPIAPASAQPSTITIPMPNLTPPAPQPTSPAQQHILPPLDPSAPWQWNQRPPAVPDLHLDHLVPPAIADS